jgi:hypothetical protein
MQLERQFNRRDDIDHIHLVGDLIGLASATTALAQHFYDSNGQPKPDVTYRNGLPSMASLNWQPVSDQLGNPLKNSLNVKDGGDWLQAHDVTETAAYASGTSAFVYALKLKSGEIKSLRAVSDCCPGEKRHQRIVSPLVLQSQASSGNLSARSSRSDLLIDTKFEILPMMPFLPDDIAGLQTLSGHSIYHPDPLHPDIVTPEEWHRLEAQKLTFASVLRAQGLGIERVADIAILPDGTPLFGDPDTVTKDGSRPVDVASARAHNILGQISPVIGTLLDCYKWVDGVARPETIMSATKQEKFFPNPYAAPAKPAQVLQFRYE